MAVVLIARPSPHYNDRPSGEISAIVLHADTAAKVAQSVAWIRDPKSKVSYHVLIGRHGDAYQLVDFAKRAWHAGESSFKGRKNVNGFSIGISFGNKQDGEPFTEAQYQTAAALIRELMQRYPDITLDRITTHSAVSPGRKTDPDRSASRFDMAYLMSLVSAER